MQLRECCIRCASKIWRDYADDYADIDPCHRSDDMMGGAFFATCIRKPDAYPSRLLSRPQ